ncbi:MAG: hypothetical protein Q8L65_02015 [Burkholderiales bacterium]|jgi:hypothetical protein|nr:hypothetical protein [Burkholderiales bacterium]
MIAKPRKICALIAAFMLQPATVHPARPMITDDARTVDPYACQVESWARTNRGSREKWALPSCNFTGNLEVTLGGAITRDAEGSATTDIVFQGKTLLKNLETNSYGIGLAVGYVGHPVAHGGRPLGGPYAYMPISLSLADDRVVLHTNVGARHVRADSSTRATWGLGSETMITPRTYLIAETFGESRDSASYQLGFRFWIVPNRVQVDTTYGNQYGNKPDSRWFSVGLRLLSTSFLK